MKPGSLTLEDRIERLEKALARSPLPGVLPRSLFLWSVGLSLGAVYLGYRGMGWPNHPYQVALAALAVGLAYHRRWLAPLRGWRLVVLGALNTAQLSLVFKLLIGSGRRAPFFWLRYPELSRVPEGQKWYDVLPAWSLVWQPSPLAVWELDLTVIQTFLLVVTLVGALFRFQPFVSLTALALLFASLPAFAGFHWDWVFPAVIASSIALYLQTEIRNGRPG